MRKLIYGGLFLTTVGISIISCRKAEPTPNQTNSLNTENADEYDIPKNGFDGEFQLGNEGRFLVFNNENGYDHAVNNPSDEVRQNLNVRVNNLNHYSWKDYVEDNPNQGLDTLIRENILQPF